MRGKLLLVASLSLSACAMEHGAIIEQSPQAAHVRMSMVAPPPDCRSLGLVSGRASGASFTPLDEHIRRATSVASEQAAARGGNFLFMQPPSVTQGQYGPTGATVLGEAFYCQSIADVDA